MRQQESTTTNQPPSRRRVTTLVMAALAGAVTAVLGIVIVVVIASRDPLLPLTPALWDEAKSRWAASGPASYDLEVRVHGNQPAVYRVEVRDGRTLHATRNGQPLRTRRTLGTWSVPGMFNTIQIDLDNSPRAGQTAERSEDQVGRPLQLELRAAMDPEYGYPQRYRRVQWGSNVDISWEVTKFRVVP